MQFDWRLTKPHLVRPFTNEVRSIDWDRWEEPFRCWPAYRRVLAYVYALRGATEAVRAQCRLPVPLGQAAQVLKRRRQVSLGHENACPFLRSAPALGLSASDVAVLEGLVSTRDIALLEEQWGYPVALPILAGALDRSPEWVLRAAEGALGRWGLVEVEEEGGVAFAHMPDVAIKLFTEDGADSS